MVQRTGATSNRKCGLSLFRFSHCILQVRSALEAATVAEADAAQALAACRDDSCTTSTSPACVHRKALKFHQRTQDALRKQKQRISAAERRAAQGVKGEAFQSTLLRETFQAANRANALARRALERALADFCCCLGSVVPA